MKGLPKLLGLGMLILGVTAADAIAAKQEVFYTDFNVDAPTQISGEKVLTSVSRYNNIGETGNTFSGSFLKNTTAPGRKTTLTLSNLPTHTSIDLNFLLAAIGSWDGLTDAGGEVGADFFNVNINGSTVFKASYDNYLARDGATLLAPAKYSSNTLTYGKNTYADIYGYPDSAYSLKLSDIPHTSKDLIIDWYANGSGWQGGTEGDEDESWAIDNVYVSVDAVPADNPKASVDAVPEPISLSLLSAGLLGLGVVNKKKN